MAFILSILLGLLAGYSKREIDAALTAARYMRNTDSRMWAVDIILAAGYKIDYITPPSDNDWDVKTLVISHKHNNYHISIVTSLFGAAVDVFAGDTYLYSFTTGNFPSLD